MATTSSISSSGPVVPFASASLYVGDLDRNVTEALLFEVFNAVGPVASVRICRDAATRRSLGYAYVNFHRSEDAERALDTMNFKPIRGKDCRIMWSHRDPSLRKTNVGNVFIKNIAKSIDNKTLYDTFSMFGNILSCKVATTDKGESLGYGFVHYESEEAAQTAIKRVDGKLISEQKVIVLPFKSKKERTGSNYAWTNLFIKNLPEKYSKEELDAFFKSFGSITSSYLSPPTSPREEKSTPARFAFVNFSAHEEAKKAMEATNGATVGDKKISVMRHQKKRERERELQQKWDQRKIERQSKYQGINLYIKNLAETVDNDRILSEFSKYGTITSAKVMQDEVGKSKGFGFVCFTTPDEASKAVHEMNGKMLEGKPLFAALAQRKDMRRAQLEAQYQQRMGGFSGPPQMFSPQGAPMFYPGMQRPVMYPPQMPMVPGQWNPRGGPMMGMPANYQLMPMQAGGGRGGPQGGGERGGGRGGRGGRGGASGGRGERQGAQGRGQQMPQQTGGPMGGPGGALRYGGNVRNTGPQGGQPAGPGPQGGPPQGGRGQRPTQGGPGPAPGLPAPAQPTAAPPQQPQAANPDSKEPLIKQLAAAPEKQKKQMIGERLFPLVHAAQPALAGKITGMLLEMDNGELIHLLESKEALGEKIDEAMQVLRSHTGEEGDEEEDEEEEAA